MRIALAVLLFAVSTLTSAQSVPAPDLVFPIKPGRPKAPPPSNCAEEPYPAAALRAGTVGKTILAFSLDADGYLEHTVVIQSAGRSKEHKQLDAAAVRSLWSCGFSRPESAKNLVEATYTWNPRSAAGLAGGEKN